MRPTPFAFPFAFLAFGATACGATSPTAPTPAPEAAPGTTLAVVRSVLAEMADPPGAEGRTLSLVRYTIAPGAKLAPHIHPGVQMASIESGTLSYTIESGTAVIRRAGATDDERLEGPTITKLGPGDSVDEVAGMVHFGANETDRPIVILASLLTVSGEGLSVTVGSTTPP